MREKIDYLKPMRVKHKINVLTSEEAVNKFLEENKDIGLVDIKMTDNRFMVIYRVLEATDERNQIQS